MTTTVRSRPRFYRDVRILTWAFQLLVFAVVAAVGLWLWGNFRRNTASSGIPTSFDFLSNPTTFSIPGADFSPNEPVRNAYIVGLINTLRVSIVGIVFATIVGVLVGIGRLSTNWLVARLAGGYVEFMRDIPLLLQLFVWYGLFTELLPPVREALSFGDLAFWSQRGLRIAWPQPHPAWQATGWALVAAIALAIGWRQAVRVRQRRTGRQWPVFAPALVLLLGLPLLAWWLGGAPTVAAPPASC